MGLIWKSARRAVVAVVGSTVLALGVAMLVLPGPAVVVIPIGLVILATEFVWARRYLRRMRDQVNRLRPGSHVVSGGGTAQHVED